VIAEARVIRKGRTLSYGEVLLRSEGEEAPCAHVTTSWAAATRRAG
jgi:acyl-coenzyme A thioesterase PaaI-like protein